MLKLQRHAAVRNPISLYLARREKFFKRHAVCLHTSYEELTGLSAAGAESYGPIIFEAVQSAAGLRRFIPRFSKISLVVRGYWFLFIDLEGISIY